MAYKIRYSYRTGDSFGSEDREGVLELTWENREAARQALKDIKEHYVLVDFLDGWDRPTEKEAKAALEKAKDQSWFVPDKYGYYHNLKLKTDDGKDWQLSAPWCGYFERLYCAEIVEEDERDKFETRYWS